MYNQLLLLFFVKKVIVKYMIADLSQQSQAKILSKNLLLVKKVVVKYRFAGCNTSYAVNTVVKQ